MANIFPIDFEEKLTMAQDDYILFSDSEDGNKIKKAQYKNLKGEQGDPGTPGQDGEDGAAATITVGSTTTGVPGSSASVTNSGTSSAAVLDFTIPQGAKGEPGEDGQDGADGAAATITVGTTTTLPAGSSATVENVGTSQDAILNFGIPKGDSGTGSGDVSGPSSSTNGDIVVFDGVSGKAIKDSGKTVAGLESGISANTTAISTINGKIPSAATSSNQLADKDYVNDGINSVTAYYITKNAQGDQWATRAELFAATRFYSGGVVRTPTKNDYTIVLDDENHDHATTRYIYNSGWEYQYTVNETALTQAQLDALNSGITSGKVSTYDGYATTISGKQDALTLPATPTQGHLVTWGADNETLQDGGAIPTGVPTVGTNGQVLTVVSGVAAWANASGGDVMVSSQSGNILTSGMKIWAGSQSDYEGLGTYDNNTVYLTI